jgi:hypothetical protein
MGGQRGAAGSAPQLTAACVCCSSLCSRLQGPCVAPAAPEVPCILLQNLCTAAATQAPVTRVSLVGAPDGARGGAGALLDEW